MLKTIATAGLLAALAFVAPVQAQMQSPAKPSQMPSAQQSPERNAQYCLRDKDSGAVNCIYQTLAQCQQASNSGNEGDCISNPSATTGTGSDGRN